MKKPIRVNTQAIEVIDLKPPQCITLHGQPESTLNLVVVNSGYKEQFMPCTKEVFIRVRGPAGASNKGLCMVPDHTFVLHKDIDPNSPNNGKITSIDAWPAWRAAHGMLLGSETQEQGAPPVSKCKLKVLFLKSGGMRVLWKSATVTAPRIRALMDALGPMDEVNAQQQIADFLVLQIVGNQVEFENKDGAVGEEYDDIEPTERMAA